MQNPPKRGDLNPKQPLFSLWYNTFAPQFEGRPRVQLILGRAGASELKTYLHVAPHELTRASEKDVETRSSPSSQRLSRGEFGGGPSSTRGDGNPDRLNGQFAHFRRFQQIFSARFGHVVD